MLILVILVSIISLGFYISVSLDTSISPPESNPVTQGAVTLQITSPPEQANQNIEKGGSTE